MEMQKKGKTMNALVIAAFSVIRVVLFSYFPNVSDKTPYVLFGILLAVYAVMTAVIFDAVGKKSDNKADNIMLLIFADFFFTMQVHSLALLTAIIWEAYVLISLSEKKSPVKEAFLIAGALISALIMPYTLFGYVLLAAFIYFLMNSGKSVFKAALVAVLAVVAGAVGFVINKFALMNSTAFVDFVNGYTMGRYSQPVMMNFAVAVPMLVVAAVLLASFFKNMKAEKKASRPADAKIIKTEMTAWVTGVAVMVAVSVIGFVIKQIDMYMLINLIVPVTLVAMLLNKKDAAEKTLEKVNGFVSKHSFAAFVIFLVIFGIQVYCIDKTGLGGEIRSYIDRLVLQ